MMNIGSSFMFSKHYYYWFDDLVSQSPIIFSEKKFVSQLSQIEKSLAFL